jgi:hypothetical protein
VQATKEVQLSARKVVKDNARLKALLRHVGVEDHVIESWTLNVADQSVVRLSSYEMERMGIVNRKVRYCGR